jgi:hypothetical protein
LADKAGLKKGDLVVKINECPTSNLSSEQLRKIMTDRLKLNSIQMTVLSLEKPDLNSKFVYLVVFCVVFFMFRVIKRISRQTQKISFSFKIKVIL